MLRQADLIKYERHWMTVWLEWQCGWNDSVVGTKVWLKRQCGWILASKSVHIVAIKLIINAFCGIFMRSSSTITLHLTAMWNIQRTWHEYQHTCICIPREYQKYSVHYYPSPSPNISFVWNKIMCIQYAYSCLCIYRMSSCCLNYERHIYSQNCIPLN